MLLAICPKYLVPPYSTEKQNAVVETTLPNTVPFSSSSFQQVRRLGIAENALAFASSPHRCAQLWLNEPLPLRKPHLYEDPPIFVSEYREKMNQMASRCGLGSVASVGSCAHCQLHRNRQADLRRPPLIL